MDDALLLPNGIADGKRPTDCDPYHVLSSRNVICCKSNAQHAWAATPVHTLQAILAMPFFNQQEWLSNPGKIWVWVALTVPSTGVAILFYIWWTRKDIRKSKEGYNAADIELNGGTSDEER